ncbi:hypothetical protein ATANTOWER_012385 [Ataeniobius toweri]|uniref:Uncharacterized protein n=1 Tax=Ataeniobius toweri TaxID=208326 RepID=A0ABU7C3D0_9TELE|nr:hypothetical protein [Ataeniobius toweri]
MTLVSTQQNFKEVASSASDFSRYFVLYYFNRFLSHLFTGFRVLESITISALLFSSARLFMLNCHLLEFMAQNILTPPLQKQLATPKRNAPLAVTQLSPTLLAFTAASAALPTKQEMNSPRRGKTRGDRDTEEGCREQRFRGG